MEKEFIGTFEAVKKAAGDRRSEVDRCLDALSQLRKIPVTMKDLVDTQVGKRLRSLTKHPQEKIQTAASDLLKYWKDVVIEETTKSNKQSPDKSSTKVEVKFERSETVKMERSSETTKVDIVSRSEIKAEKRNSYNGTKSVTLKVEASNGYESFATKKASSSASPPKLTSMVKCNNPVRDKIRELLAEALCRVSKEASESDREEVRNVWDEVDACDPIRVAVTVESAMFERLGPSTGEHKVKYRSIMFNLKDSKNPDFRRKVLIGLVEPERLADLKPEEMASDERSLSNRQIKEKAMFECERAAAPKATTDQFKCGRCGQRKTTYYQLQTRSADEPMTTFVTCVNCNNHWKFC